MDSTVAAIPVYFGTMGAEHLWLRAHAAERGPDAGRLRAPRHDHESRDGRREPRSHPWWCRSCSARSRPARASTERRWSRVPRPRWRRPPSPISSPGCDTDRRRRARRRSGAGGSRRPGGSQRGRRSGRGRHRRHRDHHDVGVAHDRRTACGTAGSCATSGRGPAALAAATLGWDFIYYWNHRFMHESRYMWAIHVVHHSSERYNLSTALRQPVADAFGTFVPYSLLALLGLHPDLIAQARGINLLYQYWIHTDTIRRLGPFEKVLQHPVAPPGAPRQQPAVHRPQPRQHPDHLGPAVRHLRTRGRARRLRPDEEPRHVQPGTRRRATSTSRCCATSAGRRPGATAFRSCCAVRAGPTDGTRRQPRRNGTRRLPGCGRGDLRVRVGRRRLHDRAAARPVGSGPAVDGRHPHGTSLLRLRRTTTQNYERKDAILAPIGPVAVLAQLVVWLALFARRVRADARHLHPRPRERDQPGRRRDVHPRSGAHRGRLTNDTITTLAGATGLIVVALQIAYLPSLYAAFNRREVLTTMLTSRAGEPAWGPEILDPASARRHHRRVARLLRVVGTMGGRGFRIARELSGLACCFVRPTRGRRGC